jgi:hypothetical protein
MLAFYIRQLETFFDSGLGDEYKPKQETVFKDFGDRYSNKYERIVSYKLTYWKPSRTAKSQKVVEHTIYSKSASEAKKFFIRVNEMNNIKSTIKSVTPTGKTIGSEKQFKIAFVLKKSKI